MLCLLTQSCLILCDLPWGVAHQAPLSMGTLQARILEWVAIPSSRGSCQPRDWTQVSHISGRFVTIWATREAHIIVLLASSCSIRDNLGNLKEEKAHFTSVSYRKTLKAQKSCWGYFTIFLCYSTVQFSCSVVSDSLWPHALQHARPPCPSPTPRAYSNSCPLSWWCHPTISSFVVPFSSCLLSFPASGSFQMRQFFTSCTQSIGLSAAVSVLPMNIQDWFPLGWTGWISLESKGLSSLLQHHSLKASILRLSAFFTVQLSHPYMIIGKTIALTRQTFVGKIMSLLLNMLSGLVITVLSRSKCLLISRLQSPSAVILEPPKRKSLTVSTVFPSMCHEVMGLDAMILVFWMLSFKPTFSLSSFTVITRLFRPSWLSAIRVVSSAYLRLLIFLLAILIPACASSSLAFRLMYSAYKLNM